MSEMPPTTPMYEINYETPRPDGNAPTLVRLAGIFGIISASGDLLFAVGMGVLVGAMYFALKSAAAAAAAAPPAVPPPPGVVPPHVPSGREMYIVMAVYAIPGLLSLLALTPKLIGSIILLKRGKRAWGWGLAMGIINCTELWVGYPCCVPIIVPLGTGIFTIIILCLPHVRAYLTSRESV